MRIILYDGFTKRKNSTKRPSGGTPIDVNLKENTSIENPSFILSTPISNATYVHVPEWGEYYFVSDCVNLNAGQCELKCACDPMANLKDAIAGTSAFILYDGSANIHLNDTRLPRKDSCIIGQDKAKLHSYMSNIGTFVCTVTGQKKTDCYVISALDVDKLIPDIVTQVQTLFYHDGFTPAGDWNDFIPGIVRALEQIISSGSLAQNIRDLRWIPFNISGVGSHTVYVGMYETQITSAGKLSLSTAYRISGEQKAIPIPWQFNDWRNAFCSDIYVHIPYVGDVSFPADKLVDETAIMVTTSVDFVTGDMAIILYGATTGVYLGSYGASTGVIIPVGNASPSLSKMVTSLANGLGNTISGGSLAGLFGKVSNSVMNIGEAAFTPCTQTVGGLSSAASAKLPFDVVINVVAHDTIVNPSSVASVMGTPTFERKTIGSCPTGFIQCSGAAVDANCRASEREVVDGYLNSGFFFE